MTFRLMSPGVAPSGSWSTRTEGGLVVRQRYTPGALAAADQIRAAGGVPVPMSWEGWYPVGQPVEITVTGVRPA